MNRDQQREERLGWKTIYGTKGDKRKGPAMLPNLTSALGTRGRSLHAPTSAAKAQEASGRPDEAQLSQRGPTLKMPVYSQKLGPKAGEQPPCSGQSRRDRANGTQMPRPALGKPNALGTWEGKLSCSLGVTSRPDGGLMPPVCRWTRFGGNMGETAPPKST